MHNISQAIDYIHQHRNCIEFAQSIGLPIHHNGDRCTSPFPGEHHTDNAFWCHLDHWFDFSAKLGGDVIELARLLKHNGNFLDAIHDLSGGISFNTQDIDRFNQLQQQIQADCLRWHSLLRPEDKDYLHSRRINNNTINSLKIGYDPKLRRLVIPYFRNGQIVYWASRDRSPAGSILKNGKPPAKYLKMKLEDKDGFQNIPWGLDSLNRSDDTIIHTCRGDFRKDELLSISEGMFDILSFWQEGYKCLSPISGFFNKKLMPQIRSICKKVKLVVTSFDNDNSGLSFTLNMAIFLIANNIPFIIIQLPEGVKDISEFYAAGGNLDKLVAEAVDGTTDILRRVLSDQKLYHEFISELKNYIHTIDNPSELLAVLNKIGRFIDKPSLKALGSEAELLDDDSVGEIMKLCMRSPSEKLLADEVIIQHKLSYIDNVGFYNYDHGVWKLFPDTKVKHILYQQLGNFATNSKVSSVCQLLKASCFNEIEFNKLHILNFINGTLDLKTLEFREHSPDDASTIQINYKYDPQAKCPTWNKFIHDVMSGDKSKIRLLQQMVGYVLFPNNCLQKAFLLMGDGSNGKSVFLAVIRELFNKQNCSAIDISQLAQPFMAIHLKDSLINICSDANPDTKKAEAMFKKIISGEDPIYDSFKGKDGIMFTPRVKTFIAGNSYIDFNTINYAILRRLLFVEFKERYELSQHPSRKAKRADPQLLEKLLGELPGIMNWAIEGYKDLSADMAFAETSEHKLILQDYLISLSPVDSFISEELTQYYSSETVNLPALYNKYVNWCKNTNNLPLNRQTFKRIFSHNIELHRPDVEYSSQFDAWIFPVPKSEPEPEPEPEHEPDTQPIDLKGGDAQQLAQLIVKQAFGENHNLPQETIMHIVQGISNAQQALSGQQSFNRQHQQHSQSQPQTSQAMIAPQKHHDKRNSQQQNDSYTPNIDDDDYADFVRDLHKIQKVKLVPISQSAQTSTPTAPSYEDFCKAIDHYYDQNDSQEGYHEQQ